MRIKRATMSSALLQIIREEISAVTGTYTPRAKFRRCLYDGEPFVARRDDHVFCSRACGSRMHYLAFNVRSIREED